MYDNCANFYITSDYEEEITPVAHLKQIENIEGKTK